MFVFLVPFTLDLLSLLACKYELLIVKETLWRCIASTMQSLACFEMRNTIEEIYKIIMNKSLL